MTAARLVRSALKSGDPSELASAYAGDAVLDASVPGSRTRTQGPAAIRERFGELWAGGGELVEWDLASHALGCALWCERVDGAGGALRQRQYLLVEDDTISRHWIYGAPPRSTAPAIEGQAAPPLFERLGVLQREPMVSTGWSGNRLERLRTRDGTRLVAKRVAPTADWIGRLSRDRGREGLLHSEGLFARMPEVIDPATVAAEPDGADAWWVVMRDVSADLLDAASPITREQNRSVLGAADRMWRTYWGEEWDFLCTSYDRIAGMGPVTSERERDGLDLLPKQLEAAWDAFAEAVEPDVAEPVLGLLADPSPLVAELAPRGSTLLHGDLRDEQLGFADGRLVVLDWGIATQGHPVIDLAWYMVHDVWRIEATHDEVVEDFRHARGGDDDPHALELGMIAGLAMYGWIFGHSAVVHPDPAERAWAREELDWWVPRVRRALEHWSP